MSPLRKSEKEDLTENPVPLPLCTAQDRKLIGILTGARLTMDYSLSVLLPPRGWSEVGAKPRGWGGGGGREAPWLDF
jgi:hypothetical protein